VELETGRLEELVVLVSLLNINTGDYRVVCVQLM